MYRNFGSTKQAAPVSSGCRLIRLLLHEVLEGITAYGEKVLDHDFMGIENTNQFLVFLVV